MRARLQTRLKQTPLPQHVSGAAAIISWDGLAPSEGLTGGADCRWRRHLRHLSAHPRPSLPACLAVRRVRPAGDGRRGPYRGSTVAHAAPCRSGRVGGRRRVAAAASAVAAAAAAGASWRICTPTGMGVTRGSSHRDGRRRGVRPDSERSQPDKTWNGPRMMARPVNCCRQRSCGVNPLSVLAHADPGAAQKRRRLPKAGCWSEPGTIVGVFPRSSATAEAKSRSDIRVSVRQLLSPPYSTEAIKEHAYC